MVFWSRNRNSQRFLIKTTRDKDSIKRTAKNGLRPLKKVVPSHEIRLRHRYSEKHILNSNCTLGFKEYLGFSLTFIRLILEWF